MPITEEIRVNTLEERIDTAERNIGDETYHIWTKKFLFPNWER